MAAHSKLWQLQRFRVLNALTDQQKREVDRMARMLEVPRAERIYLAGDPSDEIVLLKAGVVKITTAGPGGQEVILAFLYPGDILGELAIVDDSPRDHVATVHEDAVLCALNREQLLRMVQQSPVLGYQITKLMGYRLRRFRTRVEELLYKSVPARIAHTLADLAADYGVRDDAGILIPIRLNQANLGNLVGLARETVNIVLQDFRQRGLVEADRHHIRIKAPERLRAVTQRQIRCRRREAVSRRLVVPDSHPRAQLVVLADPRVEPLG